MEIGQDPAHVSRLDSIGFVDDADRDISLGLADETGAGVYELGGMEAFRAE
jgi:hypothetical protein